jgi:hypothetical protein
MTFKEIYDKIIPLWGDNVEFEDGVMLESKQSFKAPWAKSGPTEYFFSKKINALWNSIEEQITENDEYDKQMVWTLYQLFVKHAEALAGREIYTFSPADIERSKVEEAYFRNLNEPGFEQELERYERII